jgi:hypothetical protein
VIDVAILTKPRAEKLVRSAKLVGGTATVLARVPIGLAVRKGAPHPDISSVEAFKRTLLDAKSIAYVDPASGSRAASSWHRPSKSSASPLRSNPKFASFRRPAAKARRKLARSSSGARLRSAYSRSAN